MSVFHESIKSIFVDVEKLLAEIVKKDCKLNKKANESRQQILDKLQKFFEEHPEMRPNTRDNTSANDDSSMTGGSSNTDEGEDPSYVDAGVGLLSASDLKNAVFSGYLEKKQKKGSGIFGGAKLQSRWCAIQGGVFYYFVKPDDKKQCGAFTLEGYKFRNAPDVATKKKEKELSFELYHEKDDKRLYQFIARNKEDYEKWQNFLSKDGEPLIEEELYEELDTAPPPEPPKPVKPADDANEGQDIYEDPETEQQPTPPKPPPSPRQPADKPPPPLPPSLKPKMQPPEPIDEELYDDAVTPQPPPPIPPAPKRRPDMSLPEIPTPKKQIKLNLSFKPAEDFENKYYSKYDCKGDNSNELSFKKGDIIHVISKEFDGKSWWIGELNGQFGLVPKNYMTAAYVMLP